MDGSISSQAHDHGFWFPSPSGDGPRPMHLSRNFCVWRADTGRDVAKLVNVDGVSFAVMQQTYHLALGVL